MKKRILALILMAIIILSVPTFAADKIKVYAPDGRTATIYTYQLQSWKNVGWYDYPVTRMYAPDGRTSVISKNALSSWKATGWYDYPVTRMYTLDGRTAVINSNQVQAWLNVGWYTEPMTKLYSLDGRTLIVPLDETHVHTRVGWLTLNRLLFKASLSQLQNFVELEYEGFYGGVDQSGDIPRVYYKNATNYPYSHLLVSYGIAPLDHCVFTSMKLGEAFPYLKLYADKYGYISVSDINKAFADSGIYGMSYRANPTNTGPELKSITTLYRFEYDDYYAFTYDHIRGLIECDAYGQININTSIIHFRTLV